MSANKSSGGISLCTALTVLLVALKLCKVTDLSWWCVLAPIWAPWAIVALIGAACMLVAVAAKVIERIIR